MLILLLNFLAFKLRKPIKHARHCVFLLVERDLLLAVLIRVELHSLLVNQFKITNTFATWLIMRLIDPFPLPINLLLSFFEVLLAPQLPKVHVGIGALAFEEVGWIPRLILHKLHNVSAKCAIWHVHHEQHEYHKLQQYYAE